MLVLVLFLRVWKPAQVMHIGEGQVQAAAVAKRTDWWKLMPDAMLSA